jgi:starch-binding outer membrane protein, SusD/RagB family
MTILSLVRAVPRGRGAILVRPAALLAATLALVTTACHVLDVAQPDIIQPGNLATAAALPTIRAGVIGDFTASYSGSGAQGSSGTVEGQVLTAGLLSDELINTETFPDRINVDRRFVEINGATMATVFRNLSRARRSAEVAAANYRQLADTTAASGLSEMLSLAGFTYVMFGENYCSGVPISNVAPDGSLSFGMPLTTVQILDTAINRFTQAIGAANALTSASNKAQFTQMAQLGRARAFLDLGQFDSANAAAAVVPTGFSYTVTHDLNTTRQNNGVFNGMFTFKRYGVADKEGGNGLAWISVNDPRTPSYRPSGGSGLGFDGNTPQFDELRYVDQKASVTVATGLEARLIQAEAALQVGNSAGMYTFLNALRAAPPAYILAGSAANPTSASTLPPMAPLSGAGSAVDTLFAERARWLWLTAHRLSDLRRLIRQYGRATESVFPTGAYFKQGLVYATDVNFPVPIDEQNNPNFTQCLDRSP